MTDVANNNTNLLMEHKMRRSSSVLSSNGNNRRKKWTINTSELNSEVMDEERNKFKVYEYLCHVGEAKEWMERLLKKELAPISEFENQLRYGITLAELARLFSEESVKKIFESDKLQFRHSDNINYFFDALRKIKFPEIFYFETTDCYEKKNSPKVIYCLHALSHYLELRGYGKAVRDLVGKLEFTDKEVQNQYESLKQNNINLPTFNNLENKLQEELKKSTFDLNVDFDKKSEDLEEFVPSKSFYRSDSMENIVQKDNQSLQKDMFKANKETLDEEQERLEKEKAEKERLEKEKAEKERLEREEKERLEKEKAEKERLEKERLEKEKAEKERLEREKLEKEKAEKERLEKEKAEKEKEAATRAVNEETNLLNENENLPANEKCIQTDDVDIIDALINFLQDRKNWIILILILTIIHAVASNSK